MKWTVALAIGLVGAGGPVAAQEFVVSQSVEEIPVMAEPEVITVEPDPAVSGIVTEIFERPRPWQLINPAAPANAGIGRTNGTVSEDADNPGKPRGFILFALDW